MLPEGLVVEVEGAGAEGVPRDESHLVVRSMRAAFELMGEQPPGLRLTCRNVVPHARGLGSSSAAIVAGVVLARALVAGGQLLASDEALFDLAADLEGHPDNVAPAFYGGFVISGREDGHWYAVRAGVDPRVTAVVFVPPTGVETKVARGLLPDVVPHADAAANSGRAALLVAALNGQPEHLLAAHPRLAPPGPARARDARDAGARTTPARRGRARRRLRRRPDRAGLRLRRHLRPAGAVPDGWACHDLAIESVGRDCC